MPELNIVNVEYEPQFDRFILTLDNGDTLKITLPALKSLNEKIPSVNEEDRIQELIDEIHKIRKAGIKEFGELDKMAADLDAELVKIEQDLSNATNKTEVFQHQARTKVLVARKSLIQERRHLLKLSHIEEGDLRAQLAKLQRGEKQRKD